MIEFWVIASYLILGLIVGFFAGLLGIGGGAIVVPMLTTLFIAQGFEYQTVVHFALGTSMATILFTSISSLRAHHRHQAVIWQIVYKMSPGIIFGTTITTILVSFISTYYLSLIFAILMSLLSLQMWLNKKPKPSREVPNFSVTSLVSYFIGSISALIAIGGGSLTVPFLTWCNINIKKAIGTSAAVGFVIAISGAIMFWITGSQLSSTPEYSIGFIYLPALIAIASMSVLTAPFGAKMAHQLPITTLKKIFAVLFFLLSIKMFLSIQS